MSETVENTNVESTSKDETTTQEASDLNINDLAQVKMIIDVASSRGAFKPNEMTVVGTVYNKIVAFIETVAKSAEAAKTSETPEEN